MTLEGVRIQHVELDIIISLKGQSTTTENSLILSQRSEEQIDTNGKPNYNIPS